MRGRPFAVLIVVAGMSPFIALSFLSLAQSGTWAAWSERVSTLDQEYAIWRIDVTLREMAGSWAALAAGGGLLWLLALVSRFSPLSVLVVAASIAAQLPGIVPHIQFQWGSLFAGSLPIAQEPSVVVVGLALAAAPAGVYGLGTAAALERVGKSLVDGNAEPQGILAVHRGNTLVLLGVMAISLAVGAAALIPLAGIPGNVTESITGHPAVITWTGVAAFALIFGAAYSFFHRRWWARAYAGSRGEAPGAGPQPD